MKAKKLTFEECKQAHYDLWDWLAETGGVYKDDWPEFDKKGKFKGFSIENDCFACQWDGSSVQKEAELCMLCPITWGTEVGEDEYGFDGNSFCEYPGSLYTQWKDARTIKTRKKLAAKIRDLPWTNKRKK